MRLAIFARRLPAVVLGLALSACGGSSGSDGSFSGDCSVLNQNQFVIDTMQQWYLWYDQLPTLNPANYSSPDAMLDALIAPVSNPVDRFSYITTQAEEDALFGDSQFIGFGFRQQSDVDAGTVTVLDVFEGGPAFQGGLDRGSRIEAIDGVPIAAVLASSGGLTEALGPAEVGFQIVVTFRTQAGQLLTSTLTKDTVTIPPVTATRVFQLNGKQTGYLVLRNFVDPGVPALNSAFSEFRNAGVTQVIIDLRYNGGGLLRTLQHLANLLGSRIANSSGAVFSALVYNDKNSGRDEQLLFSTEPLFASLDLESLVVITTPSTASASEMLINGMAPWVDTATVGRETFGKPVGQLGFARCERVLRAVNFQTVNALGEGDYFDGIPPTCPAGDDTAFDFGEVGEASFDTAVHWLQFGFCPPTAQADRPARVTAPPRWRLNDAY